MSKKTGYTFIDLFAGVGGIRLGFEYAGARCVFTSEWDKAAQDVYEANFGERPQGDITKIAAADIPDHDILTGGFPCQTFSIIGGRLGFTDTRGTLFFDIERILKEKRPKAFLLENVRNLTAHDNGKTFQVILKHLEDLGYFVHYKVLNGLDFGVPQKRQRIIIVGFRENHPFEFPTKGLREAVTIDQVLEDEKNVHQKHYLSETYKARIMARLAADSKSPLIPGIWHENKSGNIGMHKFSCALRASASHNYLTVNGERRLTPREMFRLQGFPDTFKLVGADHQLKKMAGNSVVVPKMEALAVNIIKALETAPSVLEPIKSKQVSLKLKTVKYA